MIYLVLFSVTIFFAMCADRYPRVEDFTKKKKRIYAIFAVNKRKLYCVALCLVYILIVGCRNVTVGSDSGNYYYYLKAGSIATLKDYLTFYKDGDLGFYIYTWIIGSFTTLYPIYFLLFALFYFYVFVKFIDEYSENIGVSIWLFNTLGFATFAMSTLRQATSMAFCLLAYSARNKKQKRAWIYFILGVSFHISAVAFLPMMFIDKIKKYRSLLTRKMVLIFLCAAIFNPYIMKFLKIKVYGDKYGFTIVGGLGMIGFLVIICIIGWYYLIKLKRENEQARDLDFLIGSFFALIIFMITRFNLAAMRTYYCYLMLTIVLIPNMCKRMHRLNRIIVLGGFIMISAVFLKTTVFIDPVASKLLPYSFFWE